LVTQELGFRRPRGLALRFFNFLPCETFFTPNTPSAVIARFTIGIDIGNGGTTIGSWFVKFDCPAHNIAGALTGKGAKTWN